MRILGYDYTVKVEGTVDSIGAYGRLLCQQQTIQIAGGQSEEMQASTLLHEVIEALNLHLELRLEHRVTMSLGAGLYQVLKDAGVDLSPLLSTGSVSGGTKEGK